MKSKDKSPIPLDGFDVWDTISLGKPSPRTEILLNIDEPGYVPPGPGILGGYTGAALRMGEMKLLMNVPNVTWFEPPEIGGKFDGQIPLHAVLELPDVVRQATISLGVYLLSVPFRWSHVWGVLIYGPEAGKGEGSTFKWKFGSKTLSDSIWA